MKKILLGTTGLVGAALIASAASAETPKVTLGGFSDFQAGYTDDDNDGATRSTGFRNDNEITIKVDAKTSAGLSYGAEVALEADATNDADVQGENASRTFTYLSGNWGRAELGGNKSVAATQRVDASSIAVATGGINGAWTYFTNGVAGGGNFITTSKLPTEHGAYNLQGSEATYNATKVSYYTPKFAGLQGGVSYTPKVDDRGQTIGRSDAAGVSDIVDLGLSYGKTFGGVALSAAGTYEFGHGEGTAGTSTFGTDNVDAWNLGASLGYKGFTAAGSYGRNEESGVAATKGDYWTAGLGYAAGPVGLSATYLDSELKNAGADNKFSNLVLGADYKLAPGLTPYAEVSFYDFNGSTATNDNSGTSVILGTQLAF
jgi:hypothetical protein